MVVFDKTITHLFSNEEFETYKKNNLVDIIDAKNNYVLPGFIDIHIHGYKKSDVMDCTEDELIKMQKDITENGVTSFLPTTMTMSLDIIENALDKVKKVMESQKDKEPIGAKILGVHLEGPFISPKYKGAQDDSFIIPANFELIEKYKDILKIVTIAPETDNAIELIKQYSDLINFSIGHTNTTVEDANLAIANGAVSFTHLFNAMTPLTHRKPGAIGSAFTNNTYAELIADLFHVSPLLYNLLLDVKGKDKILLITDCIRAGGVEDGIYDLGGQPVNVVNGRCLLADGTIAGSALKLNDALKNFTENSKLELVDAVKLVTLNQAKYLGLDNIIGSIEVNKFANIVIMNDKYEVEKTIIEGVTLYEI